MTEGSAARRIAIFSHTYDEASARAIYVALPTHVRLPATLLGRLREAIRP